MNINDEEHEEHWVNSQVNSPRIEGSLEISTSKDGVWIAGNPDALRSLAKLLVWLADVDQESVQTTPEGERSHVHLYPRDALTSFSTDTELCRLDGKGTGEFPERYRKLRKPKKKTSKSARKPSQMKNTKAVDEKQKKRLSGKRSL